MVIDIKDRVKCAALQGKIVTAYDAALLINPNDKVGISGFTPSGYAKAVPLALAERMEKEPFKIDLWTGASVGDEADGALTRANGINRRFPYQTNGDTRKALNSGAVKYNGTKCSLWFLWRFRRSYRRSLSNQRRWLFSTYNICW